MSQQKTNVNVVFGAMTLGTEGAEQARVHTIEESAKLVDIFQAHGHNEIDTARVYGGGSSEEFLGALNWQERGIVMDTKLFPTTNMAIAGNTSISHRPEDLREHLKRSLAALKADKIDMWYLHAPDRKTPFEDTMREVNNLYHEGYFKRFGLSNYMSWEVAEICNISERNGWVKPVVYQGVYNAIHRAVEPELFPCLRYYGMAFYSFNPLAGGYLTSRYTRDTTEVEEGSRFDPQRFQGKGYRQRYWNEANFDALDIIRAAAKKHGLTEAECALRWQMHHSLLERKFGDAVIIGASSTSHLEQNLVDLEKGPLPEDVVQALDAAWERARAVSFKYFH